MTTARVLAHKLDHYNGVIIQEGSKEGEQLPEDPIQFRAIVRESLQTWLREGRRGIWLRIPIAKSQLIDPAIKEGFVFHHSGVDYLQLIKWIGKDANSIPEYCNFFVGVGGFVTNEKNEVLVVQEKSGPITGVWKLPGGSANPGEDIHEAARREVFEETGIQTEFESLLCFRTHHNYRFGKSDLYFVVKLRALNTNISVQESEIAAAKWTTVEEMLANRLYRGTYRAIWELGAQYIRGEYDGITFKQLPSGVTRAMNSFYCGPSAKL